MVKTMKELKNNVDCDAKFCDLEEAKKYYMPQNKLPCEKGDYLGSDFNSYCERFKEYKTELSEANSLEALAIVLNKYTDMFDSGAEYKVVEF